jgi:hypothetical protein
MNMKIDGKYPIVIAAWLTFSTCTQVIAQTAVVSSGPDSHMDTPVASSWQGLVDPLVSHPEILTKDWNHIRRVLPVGCFQKAGVRDLNCPPMDGVVRVSVDPGPLGIIDMVLKPPATCDQIYNLVSKRFGKGTVENGDKCYAEWKLNRWVKRGVVNLSPGRKEPSQLYLQFAIEQGP